MNHKEIPRYLIPYQGKHLLIKMSGELIDIQSKGFLEFIACLREMVLHRIWVILVVGWGNQISQRWKEITATPRPKWKNGENFTSKKLLDTSVIPVSEEISSVLSKIIPESEIIIAEKIHCEKVETLWYVWHPTLIHHAFPLHKVSIVSFVGVDKNNTSIKFNVNADDIALCIGKNFGTLIWWTFFLTGTWWVLDTQNNIVSFLPSSKLDAILDGTHPYIEADGGMKKKLSVAYEFLKIRPSLVITNIEHFSQEVTNITWSGTYIANEEKISISHAVDKDFFYWIYQSKVASGKWKERDEKGIDAVFQSHKMISIEWMPLWWLSLNHTHILWVDGYLIEALWTAEEGCWLWKITLEKLTLWFSPLFAFSHEKEFFYKAGFTPIDWEYSESWAFLFVKK